MKIRGFIVVGLFVFLLGPAVFAQTWSEEQKDVLKTVDGVFKAAAEGNAELVKGSFSPDYRGWHLHAGDPHPKSMDQVAPWMEHAFKKSRIHLYTIHPLAIDIHGDTAAVFYVCDMLYTIEGGKEQRQSVKMLDVYQKQDGKWLLIADFTE